MATAKRVVRGRIIPRTDGKRIEELVGMATTKTSSVSVAKMLAPPGWSEPAQTPEFDEVVVVSRGQLTVVLPRGRKLRVAAGETALVPRGVRVVYRNDEHGACEYLSICAPAFRLELAHVEPPTPRASAGAVVLDLSHPRARRHAKFVESSARRFLEQLQLGDVELSISLVGDTAIRRLNRTWRRKDKPTDVLSFPAGEMPAGTPGRKPLGDVVISLDTAARASKPFGRTLEEELARYLAHGILHLLGYDHEASPKEEKRMRAMEERLLGARGMI